MDCLKLLLEFFFIRIRILMLIFFYLFVIWKGKKVVALGEPRTVHFLL